jgi:hypothetical protein
LQFENNFFNYYFSDLDSEAIAPYKSELRFVEQFFQRLKICIIW